MSKDPSIYNQPHGYRYVAVCDVLGFKSLLKNQPLKSVVNQYYQLMEGCNFLKHHYSNLFPATSEETDFVQITVFSDSIIIYSIPIENIENVIDIGIVSTFFDVCELILKSSIHMEIPVRIGISYGETFFDKPRNIFVGQPIVAAHLSEENQNWIGGACHVSCNEAPFFRDYVFNLWQNIISYPIPTKDNSQCLYALNWQKFAFYKEVKNSLETMLNKITDKTVQVKYIETIKYLDWYYDSNKLYRELNSSLK